MASRKKTPKEPELITNEIEIDAKPVNVPARKVVETKTITYEEPVNEDEDEDTEDDFIQIENKPSYRKAAKSERTKAKERWQKRRGATSGLYRIRIDRLPLFDVNGQTGVNAERKFVKMMASCTGKYIDDEEYLEVIRGMVQTGQTQPGAFWIQILDSQGIVDQWAEFVDGGQAGIVSGVQPVAIADPANPGQVIVQMPQQAQVQADPFGDFDKTLKMFERMEKMRQSLGLSPIQPNPEPQKAELTPEQQLAATLLLDPDVKKKAVKSLLGSNGDSGERDLVTLAIEHGPALIEAAGTAIRNIISDMRKTNGTAQTLQTPHLSNGYTQDQRQEHGQDGQIQAIQESNGQTLESHSQAVPEAILNPEDVLLASILDACKRRIPPKIAAKRAVDYADLIENQAPHLSVYGFVEYFNDGDVDAILPFIEAYNDQAKEVLAMPHAKEWAKHFQAELKAQYEQEGQDGIQS